MQRILLLDIDGILTDFHSAVADIATQAGFSVNSQQMEEWEMSASLKKLNAPQEIIDLCLDAMASEGFNSKLVPTPEAKENLPKLLRLIRVVFVTSPNDGCSTWADERIRWMGDNFEIPPESIVFSHNKAEIDGDAFVDDNPNNVIQWFAKHRGAAAIWDAPYNRNAKFRWRIRSWKELMDLAKFLRELP